MPSSGLPITNLFASLCEKEPTNDEENLKLRQEQHRAAVYVTDAARRAMEYGLFVEWLQSFVGAFNETKDPYKAAQAGIIEWDL